MQVLSAFEKKMSPHRLLLWHTRIVMLTASKIQMGVAISTMEYDTEADAQGQTE